MTFERGAAACLKLGCHRYVKTEPGIATCVRCDDVSFIAYTAVELGDFDARDAGEELNRAEAEAFDWYADGERDLRSHEAER